MAAKDRSSQMGAPQARSPHRIESREKLPNGAVILQFQGDRHIARLLNRSSQGMGVILAQDPEPGEVVIVKTPNGETRRGEFCWSRRGRAGIRFSG